jgi:hypothetical protein
LYLKIKVIFVKEIIEKIMKKVVVILALAILTAIAFSSCNHETCPAYRNGGTNSMR